jgi:hypothetical protein
MCKNKAISNYSELVGICMCGAIVTCQYNSSAGLTNKSLDINWGSKPQVHQKESCSLYVFLSWKYRRLFLVDWLKGNFSCNGWRGNLCSTCQRPDHRIVCKMILYSTAKKDVSNVVVHCTWYSTKSCCSFCPNWVKKISQTRSVCDNVSCFVLESSVQLSSLWFRPAILINFFSHLPLLWSC